MNAISRMRVFALALIGALFAGSVAANATVILYVASSGAAQTASQSFVAMQNLTLTLPAAVGSQTAALVMLDVPNPYSVGTNYPGAYFGISVNGGGVLTTVACFTTDLASPATTGRHPTTLIVRIPLTSAPQQITVMWEGVRGSTVKVDTPNTLSAILE